MRETGSARSGPLQGTGVLVTRPVRQSANLCGLIEARGGLAICFPAIEIEAPQDLRPARRLLERLSECDIALFVSPNAVRAAFALIGARALPSGLKVGAVGRGTEKVLNALGIDVDICPIERYDSEGLLASAALQSVAGARVFIFRGVGGRALLGDVLEGRGAEVHYVEVYRRVCPRADPDPLIRRWRDDVDVVTVTSQEILENLFRLLGSEGGALLRRTPLVVISERVAEHARGMGCRRVEVSARADDEAIVELLESRFSATGG